MMSQDKALLQHHVKGSTLPPTKPDTLRLYSMHFCPYAHRTRLVLKHKNIEHETVNVNLKRKPEWFLERNYLGLVPVLECNDNIVYESAVCNEYLDEVYPSNKLYPTDPYEKARVKMIMARFDNKFTSNAQKYVAGDADLKKMIWNDVFDYLEKLLEDKTYFGGDSVNILDYHMWPFFERLCLLGDESPLADGNRKRFPRLSQWEASMRSTEVVAALVSPEEIHKRYGKALLSGEEPAYDELMAACA